MEGKKAFHNETKQSLDLFLIDGDREYRKQKAALLLFPQPRGFRD